MLAFYLEMFGVSLVLTLAIEMGLAAVFKVRGKSFLIVLLVNILTNPAAVYIVYFFKPGLFGEIIVEAAVALIEGVIYYIFSKREGFLFKRPFLISVVLNTISYSMGLIMEGLIYGKI